LYNYCIRWFVYTDLDFPFFFQRREAILGRNRVRKLPYVGMGKHVTLGMSQRCITR